MASEEYVDPSNLSDADYEDFVVAFLWPRPFEMACVVLFGVLMAVGIIGNALVIYVVVSKRSMWTSMNILLTNLAASDMLVLAFCLPPTLLNDVTKTFFFTATTCKAVVFLQNTSVYVSIFSLVSIAFERWRAIVLPLSPPFVPTAPVLLLMWTLSMCLSLPEPLTLDTFPYHFQRINFSTIWGTQCRATWSIVFERRYQTVQTMFFFLLPLLVISVLCAHMMRTLAATTLCLGSRQRRAVRMLMAVVCAFAVSYLPVHANNLAIAFDLYPHSDDANEDWIALRKLAPRFCSYSSSCLNPILYNFMCGKFRKEFARCLCGKKPKRRVSSGGGRSTDAEGGQPLAASS